MQVVSSYARSTKKQYLIKPGQGHERPTDALPAIRQLDSDREGIRALAVSSAKRSASLPDLPTISEAGLPGYDATAWYGMFAPTGTPKKIIAKLNAGLNKGIKQPDFVARLGAEGMEPVGITPEEFAPFIKSETARWGKVIKAAGVKVQ